MKKDTKEQEQESLQTYWNSLRTRFGKLAKKKCGDGASVFSIRD
jgi:hypothetical protein